MTLGVWSRLTKLSAARTFLCETKQFRSKTDDKDLKIEIELTRPAVPLGSPEVPSQKDEAETPGYGVTSHNDTMTLVFVYQKSTFSCRRSEVAQTLVISFISTISLFSKKERVVSLGEFVQKLDSMVRLYYANYPGKPMTVFLSLIEAWSFVGEQFSFIFCLSLQLGLVAHAFFLDGRMFATLD